MDGRFLQVRIAGGGSGSASVALDGDVVTLDGTDLADRIETDDAGAIINAYVNGVGRSFARPPAASYRIDARGGNDVAVVEFFGSEVPARIFGSDGDDRLVGGRGNDTIFGGNGYDRIDGEDGDDRLSGGDGRDWIRGQDEKDTILGEGWGDFLDGGGGNDVIEGGGFADQLTGGRGEDTLHGDLGNDIFHSADGTVDQLLGEAGTDDATDADENDLLTSIETI
jgi:Ca2+-binding RTX toxin-like protein